MRDDMDRVVIERPRRWDYAKPADRGTIRQNRRDPESAPTREPINVKRQKTPDDLLGPLKKFLTSQVGRPWTAVHSELSRVLPRNSRMNLHVWQHIEAYVQKSSACAIAESSMATSWWFAGSQVPMTAKSSSPRSQARRRSSGSAFNPQGRTSCPRIPSSHR